MLFHFTRTVFTIEITMLFLIIDIYLSDNLFWKLSLIIQSLIMVKKKPTIFLGKLKTSQHLF
ncbi:hypothetical protein BpHYR1_042738 [Brachionus plicatilis]|uniref:Uncharacterized protein n=1 Tax=Brachionus plicatilis TaxID=10195 RepID=A0A3M7SAP8_BRAPC|nr:hypothetical protein BpHYR1_042738 [Brachionus plicatilis]